MGGLPGRPPAPMTELRTIRLRRKLHQELKQLAEAQGISPNAAISRSIALYVSRHQHDLRARIRAGGAHG